MPDGTALILKVFRRFLRKPNEAEAAEGFISLGHYCESEELPQYAAMNWLAAARCEGSLGHPVSETSLLVRAGRQFLKAGTDDLDIGCISLGSESLEVLTGSLVCSLLVMMGILGWSGLLQSCFFTVPGR